jgi:hypothetical protein
MSPSVILKNLIHVICMMGQSDVSYRRDQLCVIFGEGVEDRGGNGK